MRWLWLFLLPALVVPATATVFRSGGTVTIPAEQVIDDDLVVSGGEVRMNGRVTGDLVVAGGDVQVAGPVGGNLIVAAGDVQVSGPVGGSVYAASGDVELNAPVARNVLAAGGTVVLGEAATVGRDVSVSGGEVTVRSSIGRHLRANAGTLALAEGAVVGGNVIAQAGSHEIAPGAQIQGEEQITRARGSRGAFAPLGWFVWQLLTGLALLLAGLVFITLAPRLTEDTETALRAKPWVSLAAGLLILLVGLPLFLLLLFTIIGIPLALIWAAVYTTAVYISPIFLAILVGRLVWRRPGGSLYLALLIGIGLLFLVRLIPFLGALVTLAAVLFGLGALSVALFNRAQQRRQGEVVETGPEAPPQAA
jgi:cytoskeletal protein CcmA (bactofilin family)